MSTELIIMIGVSFAIGIIMISMISYFFRQQIDDRNIETAKDILVSVENELYIAENVEPGYSRSFEVPLKLNNEEYNISIIGGNLILTYKSIDFFSFLPNMTGDLNKGTNIVRNIDGRVCLNLDSC